MKKKILLVLAAILLFQTSAFAMTNSDTQQEQKQEKKRTTKKNTAQDILGNNITLVMKNINNTLSDFAARNKNQSENDKIMESEINTKILEIKNINNKIKKLINDNLQSNKKVQSLFNDETTCKQFLETANSLINDAITCDEEYGNKIDNILGTICENITNNVKAIKNKSEKRTKNIWSE